MSRTALFAAEVATISACAYAVGGRRCVPVAVLSVLIGYVLGWSHCYGYHDLGPDDAMPPMP